MGRIIRHVLPCALLVAGAIAVSACNIPVFRYALERWKPDTSEIIVFQGPELTGKETSFLKRLTAQTIESGGNTNAKVVVVDVDNPQQSDSGNGERLDLWNSLREAESVELPHVLVRTKVGRGRMINHWHGSLKKASESGLFESPARTEIRDRLLKGHSVVWLLIASDDQAKNREARRLVEKSFETLEGKIELPEGIGLPGSELYADVPLVLRYSLIEIDPSTKEEEFLVGLLTGLRQEAFDQGQPLVIPVFGRGRALEVIPAENLTPRLVEELTVFLSGACSCQVKEQNPGFDLLINADWDGELFGDPENRPPDRSAQEGQNRNPVLVPIPQGRK